MENFYLTTHVLTCFAKEGSINGNLAEQYLTGLSGQNATIVFGAVSKGIIRRDQQNNAGVYKTYYAAANPFQQMDPNDLEKYKKEVAQKQIKEQGKLTTTAGGVNRLQ